MSFNNLGNIIFSDLFSVEMKLFWFIRVDYFGHRIDRHHEYFRFHLHGELFSDTLQLPLSNLVDPFWVHIRWV